MLVEFPFNEFAESTNSMNIFLKYSIVDFFPPSSSIGMPWNPPPTPPEAKN